MYKFVTKYMKTYDKPFILILLLCVADHLTVMLLRPSNFEDSCKLTPFLLTPG